VTAVTAPPRSAYLGTVTPATPELLKETFPAFAAVANATVQYWLDRAARIVTDAWAEADQQHAHMLLAAHYLTSNGFGTGAEAEVAAQGMSGFKSMRSGSLSLDRGDTSGVAAMGEYGSTSYGRQFWPILQANRGGVRVLAPCTGLAGYSGLDPRIPRWPAP
jgi:hypothetical protein